jgi:UDP-N-acetyl-D-mannosaminuronic acid transferase (WecB/TagA/CpsF family)
MQRSQLQAEKLYFDMSAQQYLVSPDGIGAVWYETLAEAESCLISHTGVHFIENLED